MIAPLKHTSQTANDWQTLFLELLPQITSCLKHSFRHLPGDSRAEAIQEGLASALVACRQLCERGKQDVVYPTVLARYAAKQYFAGRRVATPQNSKDVFSRSSRNGSQLERLDRFNQDAESWSEILVEDKTAGPADIVPTRIDFAAWLQTLPARERRIANRLATGETTSAAARLFHLSPARISQLRRQLRDAWLAFQGEPAAA